MAGKWKGVENRGGGVIWKKNNNDNSHTVYRSDERAKLYPEKSRFSSFCLFVTEALSPPPS